MPLWGCPSMLLGIWCGPCSFVCSQRLGMSLFLRDPEWLDVWHTLVSQLSLPNMHSSVLEVGRKKYSQT